jgi:hypothetical protein
MGMQTLARCSRLMKQPRSPEFDSPLELLEEIGRERSPVVELQGAGDEESGAVSRQRHGPAGRDLSREARTRAGAGQPALAGHQPAQRCHPAGRAPVAAAHPRRPAPHLHGATSPSPRASAAQFSRRVALYHLRPITTGDLSAPGPRVHIAT